VIVRTLPHPPGVFHDLIVVCWRRSAGLKE
jgi:hypothetical protein